MNQEPQQIHGLLLTATTRGGPEALWRIARGKGPLATKAREVIELATSPLADVSMYQAINIVCQESKL